MSQTLYPIRSSAAQHRFTVDEYLRMADGGVLNGTRVELINGEIIDMPAQQNDHAFGIRKLLSYLDRAFPEDAFWVRIQSSLRIGENVPDPDLAVLSGPPHGGKSIPVYAFFVAEISDTTLFDDLNRKASLYASGNIPEYWVIDIPNRQVVIHREPAASSSGEFGSAYGSVNRFELKAQIPTLANASATVTAGSLFPPVET